MSVSQDIYEPNKDDHNYGNKTYGTKMSRVEPLPLTYQRGERHVFAASKRQGAMPSTSKNKLEKGKEKVTVGDKKGKHQTKQECQFIDLDSENEDEERITSILLQSKDAAIRDLQRKLGMAKYIIKYYKDENKQLKKTQRDLGLQKKMAKHYALGNKFARAKLKGALGEIQAL